MKTRLRPLGLLSALLIGALLWPAYSVARDIDPASVAEPSSVRPATAPDYKDHGFDKMKGSAVRAADGKRLGEVSDLLLDARSGELRFVIVESGGFIGLGGERRLLPVEALIRDPKEKGFITRLQRVDWDLLPALDKPDLKEGRIRLTNEQRSNLEHLGDQSWARAFSPLADAQADPHIQRHILATALTGKPLYGENEKVGKVQDLYVDPAGGPALAVVEIDRGYVPTNDRTFFVPIADLEVPAGENGRVHTTLTAAQFEQVAGISPATADRDGGPWVRRDRRERVTQKSDFASRPTNAASGHVQSAPARTDEPTPTGYSTGFNRGSNDELNAAVQSVRDSWAADPALNKYPLQVATDGQSLVLTGTVPTVRLAQRAQDTAHRVTSHVAITSRLRVDDTAR